MASSQPHPSVAASCRKDVNQPYAGETDREDTRLRVFQWRQHWGKQRREQGSQGQRGISHCAYLTTYVFMGAHLLYVQEMSVHLHAGKYIGAQGCVMCKGTRVMQKMCRQVCQWSVSKCVCVCKHLAQLCSFVPMHLCGKAGEKGEEKKREGQKPHPHPYLLTVVNQQL